MLVFSSSNRMGSVADMPCSIRAMVREVGAERVDDRMVNVLLPLKELEALLLGGNAESDYSVVKMFDLSVTK